MPEETELDDTDELCPDCLESVEDCICGDDDESECEECGELLEECTCEDITCEDCGELFDDCMCDDGEDETEDGDAETT